MRRREYCLGSQTLTGANPSAHCLVTAGALCAITVITALRLSLWTGKGCEAPCTSRALSLLVMNIWKTIRNSYKIFGLEYKNREQFSERWKKKERGGATHEKIKCRAILSRVYWCNSRPCINIAEVIEVLGQNQNRDSNGIVKDIEEKNGLNFIISKLGHFTPERWIMVELLPLPL